MRHSTGMLPWDLSIQPYHFFTLEFSEQLEDFLRINEKGKIFSSPFHLFYRVQVSYKNVYLHLKIWSQYILPKLFLKVNEWLYFVSHLWKPPMSQTCWLSLNDIYLHGNWMFFYIPTPSNIWDCFGFQDACHKVNLDSKFNLVLYSVFIFQIFCNYIILILEIKMWEKTSATNRTPSW